jgi:hypothetical protein
MLNYNPRLKGIARSLRSNSTDSEQRLWIRLRRKQILAVQFYRQKPIGQYVVDFYAPAAGLGIGYFRDDGAKGAHLCRALRQSVQRAAAVFFSAAL